MTNSRLLWLVLHRESPSPLQVAAWRDHGRRYHCRPSQAQSIAFMDDENIAFSVPPKHIYQKRPLIKQQIEFLMQRHRHDRIRLVQKLTTMNQLTMQILNQEIISCSNS